MQPETRYARNGDISIAYQVIGDGPIDLVLFGTFVSHVELIWENPDAADFLQRLASFSRLIIFDKRGVGMSDPMTLMAPPTLEERLGDVKAVMDAAGAEQAALFGSSEGAQLAALFATTYPERTRAIIMLSSFARIRRSDDYPIGIPSEVLEQTTEFLTGHWGEPGNLELVLPSVCDDEHKVRWWSQFFRRSSSPGAAVAQIRMNADVDVTDLLPLVQAPTLVLHAEDDQWIRADAGRFLAERIGGARYVELSGGDHLPYAALGPRVAEETQAFLTGTRPAIHTQRVLATVLFSDIVGSTERAVVVGDQRWRAVLEAHNRDVRRQIERFQGWGVRSTGDGFIALFDGPAKAIQCAGAMREAARAHGLEIRIGIHTGEIEKRADDEVAGIGVHIGARVAANAGPGEILVSGVVPSLVVGSGLDFVDRGVHELKGIPGIWQLYSVASA